MEINQTYSRINYTQRPKSPSFGSIFRINIYNFEKANRKISTEILKDELCPGGKIVLNGKSYARKKILNLFTYFICDDKHDQHFIDKLEALGLKFDYLDRTEYYELIIRATTVRFEKMAGPIKSLYAKISACATLK